MGGINRQLGSVAAGTAGVAGAGELLQMSPALSVVVVGRGECWPRVGDPLQLPPPAVAMARGDCGLPADIASGVSDGVVSGDCL